jgi:hypothetical protein
MLDELQVIGWRQLSVEKPGAVASSCGALAAKPLFVFDQPDILDIVWEDEWLPK